MKNIHLANKQKKNIMEKLVRKKIMQIESEEKNFPDSEEFQLSKLSGKA